jgi:pyruvate dehydrogenase E1 component
VVVAASDYLKNQPDMIARWIGRPVVTLGTDGFGRSEDRASLRDFFEVDARHIAAATLAALHRRGDLDARTVGQAFKDLHINPDKADPAVS